jgi:hypothetical protein
VQQLGVAQATERGADRAGDRGPHPHEPGILDGLASILENRLTDNEVRGQARQAQTTLTERKSTSIGEHPCTSAVIIARWSGRWCTTPAAQTRSSGFRFAGRQVLLDRDDSVAVP